MELNKVNSFLNRIYNFIHLIIYYLISNIFKIKIIMYIFGDWGLGIGDWGLGIGD